MTFAGITAHENLPNGIFLFYRPSHRLLLNFDGIPVPRRV